MKFRIGVAIASAASLCVVAGLAFAQVKVTEGTPASTPASTAPKVPGQLAVNPTDPDTDIEVSPAGEPIVVHVQNIVVPVLVFDRDGNIMNNLQPSQFRLFDNGREQDIHVDTEFQPISLVIAVEASYRDDAILKQIHKIGSMIEPLVIGDAGEAAVVAFDHRVRTLQDFTSDPQKIKDAIAKVSSGSSQSHMVDAVDSSILMLRHRPKDRRRIILLISETRDQGSMARGKPTLTALNLSNVTVYSVDISQVSRRFTEQPEPPRPDAIAPEARNLPMGANTPLGVQHTTGYGNSIEFVPALREIYTDTKAIFVKDPVKVFTKGTGGAQFSFVKQRGLEDAIAQIGTQIHSQYLITYRPRKETLLEGGFHEIRVDIDYPRARVQTRPGYWMAGVN